MIWRRAGNPIRTTRLVTCTSAAVLLALIVAVSPVLASRNLGGHMYWKPRTDISPNTVEFHILYVEQLNSPGLEPPPMNVGDIYEDDSKTKSFSFGFTGPGAQLTASDIRFIVRAINRNENWVLGEILAPGSNDDTAILVTYPNLAPRIAETQNACCLPPYDQLNATRSWRLFSRVVPGGLLGNPNEGSPRSSLLDNGIVHMNIGPGATCFNIPIDLPAAGITRKFRKGDRVSGETGSSFYREPPGITLDVNTGLVCWDTSIRPDGSAWSFAVQVEDFDAVGGGFLTSSTVYMEIVTCATSNVITYVAPSPACGSTIDANPNVPLSFTVQAHDAATVPGGLATITATTLPAGSSVSPAPSAALVTNPALAFSWTPTAGDIGDHIATFSTTDACGDVRTCSYVIKVNAASPPLSLTSITPNVGADTEPITATVRGSGIVAGASVKLAKSGEADIAGTGAVVNGDSLITATFDLTGKAEGLWDVVVTNPDLATSTLASAFTVAPGLYTIPALYANRTALIGHTIRLLAQTTSPSESLLVHSYGRAMLTQEFPDSFVVKMTAYQPVEERGATIIATGVVGEDPLEFSTQNLTFAMSTYTVELSGFPAPPTEAEGVLEAEADCGNCKYAVLISGGINKKKNWPGFWKDLVRAYNFVKAQGVCDDNIKVFYFNGIAPDGAITAEVRAATRAGITAHIAGLAPAIEACKNANKPSELWVIVSDHGSPGGNISLQQIVEGFPTEVLTPAQLVGALQPVIDKGLGRLEVRLAQCFAGITLEALEGLVPKDCNIRIATAAGRNDCSWFYIDDGSFWLKKILTGNGIEEEIRAGNAAYDAETDVVIAEMQRERAAFQARMNAAGSPTELEYWRDLRDHKDAEIATYQSARGKQRWFRSIAFKRHCEWASLQVTPGGRIDLTFTGLRGNCGNATVYRKFAVNRLVKLVRWNWNVPGSTGFRIGNDRRALIAPVNGLGIYWFHNDDGKFRLEARSTNPAGSAPALASGQLEQVETAEDGDNPELYAGFTMGGDDSTSAEFGNVVAPLVTVVDSAGLDLSTLPQRLGTGGAGSIAMGFSIARQNQWWDDTEVALTVLSGTPGSLRVQCTSADSGDVTIAIPQPGQYTAHLGAIAGTGSRTLTLSALSGSMELDVWELRSRVPIPDPETLVDYADTPISTPGGTTHYTHVQNTCAAEEAVDYVPRNGCSDPSHFPSGRDVIYGFTVSQASIVEIDAHGAGNADEQVMAFTNTADPLGSCVASADLLLDGPQSEHLSGLNLSPGRYYVSTSLADAGCGDVTVTIDSNHPLGVEQSIARGLTFHPNFPNPFSESTTLSFDLPRPGHVKIELFDLAGHRVKTIADARMTSGPHRLVMRGKGLAPGVYHCRLDVDGRVITRRLLLVR
jgi:hypothetical protein